MLKKLRIRTVLVAALAGLALPYLAACNGESTSFTGPSPVAGDERTVIVSQRFADVEPGDERAIDFSITRSGELSVRVNWNDENNSVYAVVTRAGCPDLRGAADSCRARGGSARRQQDTESTLNYAETAGAYRLWLHNEGPGTESLLVTVELAPELSDPSVPPAPQRPGREPERSPRER